MPRGDSLTVTNRYGRFALESGPMKSGDLIVSEAKRNSEQSLRAPWWSFTKTVLAGAALVLVDQRKLRLDAR